MGKNRICLVIIFNHRYDKNIDILEEMYQGRFEDIFYLVPFYDGQHKNVIPVYESSYQFQGYVAQGMRDFYDEKFTQYLFIGDDLILNPAICQDNIAEYLEIGKDSSYLSEFAPLSELKGWNYKVRHFNAYRAFEEYNGCNYKKEIMSREDAFQKVEKMNCHRNDFILKREQLFNGAMTRHEEREFCLQHPRHVMKLRKGIDMPYPFFGGYSDLFLLHKKDIVKTAKMFGVFASMRLFAEIAIPTAMVLNCEQLQKDVGRCRGMVLWEEEEKKQLEERYSRSLTGLLERWPEECSYIHPVKLSIWRKKNGKSDHE